MKLQRDSLSHLNLITGYSAESIVINGTAHPCNLAVTPESLLERWAPGQFDALSAVHLGGLLELKPSLVLLGTGARQHFPKPEILRPLIEAGIGYEIMDTGSACRTYNILASEGRRVVAALLLPVGV